MNTLHQSVHIRSLHDIGLRVCFHKLLFCALSIWIVGMSLMSDHWVEGRSWFQYVLCLCLHYITLQVHLWFFFCDSCSLSDQDQFKFAIIPISSVKFVLYRSLRFVIRSVTVNPSLDIFSCSIIPLKQISKSALNMYLKFRNAPFLGPIRFISLNVSFVSI